VTSWMMIIRKFNLCIFFNASYSLDAGNHALSLIGDRMSLRLVLTKTII